MQHLCNNIAKAVLARSLQNFLCCAFCVREGATLNLLSVCKLYTYFYGE
jgi:hypothetical protein